MPLPKYLATSSLPAAFFCLSLLFGLTAHAQCNASLRGTTSLACQLDENGKRTLVERLADGSTKEIKASRARKRVKSDKRSLKKASREINQLSRELSAVDQMGISSDEAATLQGTDNILMDFGNSTQLSEDIMIQDLTRDQAEQVARELKNGAKKTLQENRRIERGLRTTGIKQAPSGQQKTKKGKSSNPFARTKVCKKRKLLRGFVCSSETSCNDGVDNDEDGNTDCDDTDCDGTEQCSRCEEGEHQATLSVKSGDLELCACYNRGFVEWDENLSIGATSVTAVIDWTCSSVPREQTETLSDPYDNSYSINGDEVVLMAPAGSNWIKITGNTASGPVVDGCVPDCSNGLANIDRCVANPRVRINCPG